MNERSQRWIVRPRPRPTCFRALVLTRRRVSSRIDPFMPWAFTNQMTDDEIRSTWLYLKSVPPSPTRTR